MKDEKIPVEQSQKKQKSHPHPLHSRQPGKDHAGLLFRRATVAERPAIAQITKHSYAEYAEASDPVFWTRYEASTAETLLSDDTKIRYIVQDEDKIVGTVLLSPPYEVMFGDQFIKNPYPEMRLLAVLPQYRNAGIGALIIDECERLIQAQNWDAITLHTTILMKTAMAMYERRGYQRYEAIDFEPAPGFIVWGFIKQLEKLTEQEGTAATHTTIRPKVVATHTP